MLKLSRHSELFPKAPARMILEGQDHAYRQAGILHPPTGRGDQNDGGGEAVPPERWNAIE